MTRHGHSDAASRTAQPTELSLDETAPAHGGSLGSSGSGSARVAGVIQDSRGDSKASRAGVDAGVRRPASGARSSIVDGIRPVQPPTPGHNPVEVAETVEEEADGEDAAAGDGELRARIVARMWADGWVGTATITPEAVAEKYRDDVAERRAAATIRSMFDDEDCPLRLDPEGSVGRDGSSASVSPDPIEVMEYVESLDESALPADLRHV